ncbi:MAG TPA: hypothetical protein VFK06_02720 [Candidatus Angelobacter sp.]|nr:hypothetical protein [Candidatus Angelobacter sp.]
MEFNKVKFSITLICSLLMVLTIIQMLREAFGVPKVWTAALVLAACVALWSWEIPSLSVWTEFMAEEAAGVLDHPHLAHCCAVHLDIRRHGAIPFDVDSRPGIGSHRAWSIHIYW